MRYLIGTDEAGYGPNLGPLVISASVWEVPDSVQSQDLFQRLEGIVTCSPAASKTNGLRRIPIADSKILYRSKGDLRHLERGLWAAWALLEKQPRSWREVCHALTSQWPETLCSEPWFEEYNPPAPDDEMALGWQRHAPGLQEAFLDAEVRLVALRSRIVFAKEFNALLDIYSSKGALLSDLTLKLVQTTIAGIDHGLISVLCDKHGGRNRYGAILSRRFPDCFIEVHAENRRESLYRFGPKDRRIEFRFRAKAEQCLPAALASMSSKYLRELAMRAFNKFWCDRITGLASTAGYPQDARRFKAAIDPLQRELGIDDNALWRVK
ncbi:MAG: hypothetical protein ACWGMZ_03720 [Thermoguttaceae bacterium]